MDLKLWENAWYMEVFKNTLSNRDFPKTVHLLFVLSLSWQCCTFFFLYTHKCESRNNLFRCSALPSWWCPCLLTLVSWLCAVTPVGIWNPWVFLWTFAFRMQFFCLRTPTIFVFCNSLTLAECSVTRCSSTVVLSVCGWIPFVCCRAEGGRRHGYMGHLTRIANCIVHSTDKGPNSTLVQQLIKGNGLKFVFMAFIIQFWGDESNLN